MTQWFLCNVHVHSFLVATNLTLLIMFGTLLGSFSQWPWGDRSERTAEGTGFFQTVTPGAASQIFEFNSSLTPTLPSETKIQYNTTDLIMRGVPDCPPYFIKCPAGNVIGLVEDEITLRCHTNSRFVNN